MNADRIIEILLALLTFVIGFTSFWLATKTTRIQGHASIKAVDSGAFARAKEIYEAALTTLREELATARGDLATARSELATTRMDLASTRSDLSDARSDLSVTRTDLATARKDIALLRTDIAHLQTEIEHLRNEQGGGSAVTYLDLPVPGG